MHYPDNHSDGCILFDTKYKYIGDYNMDRDFEATAKCCAN